MQQHDNPQRSATLWHGTPIVDTALVLRYACGRKREQHKELVDPVGLGKGKRLFNAGTTATLKLLESQAFSSGVVALVYEPDRT